MPTKLDLGAHADGVERLLGILGYAHLRARATDRFVIVESGPPEDPYVHLRLRPIGREDWRVELPSPSGRWRRTPFEGPRGNVIAEVHNLCPFILAIDPDSAGG
jgi:hypothetical protein